MSRVELATNVTEYYRNLGGSGRDVVFLRIAVHGTTRHGIVYGGSYARDSIAIRIIRGTIFPPALQRDKVGLVTTMACGST
jgi:hypothetical protein